MAVPSRKRGALQAAARAAGIDVTRIGRFVRGRGVTVTVAGRAVAAPRKGYVHF